MKKLLALPLCAALSACSVGTAEDTRVVVASKNANQALVAIHISLLNHPADTHVLGYNKMQAAADQSCAEFGKSARYTGEQEQRGRNSYDAWILRTYTCG